jgi:hypothetical protein
MKKRSKIYYYVYDGQIRCVEDKNRPCDKKRRKSGNYFKTFQGAYNLKIYDDECFANAWCGDD